MGTINKFAKCLVGPERQCSYAMDYGESRFCRHPQWEIIVAHTEAAERLNGG
jgi:hypothetical protein